MPSLIRNDSQLLHSKIQAFSLAEKVGQLFMVPAWPNKGEQEILRLKNIIKKYHIGGIICFQGDKASCKKLIGEAQAASKIPLLIGMDAEWGAAMRLADCQPMPTQQQLGATNGTTCTKATAKLIARELRDIGVHVSFSPVVDINSNPKNPVIGFRSFGSDAQNVATKAVAFMEGLQEEGVMACAKHFPGHGDTEVDSHLSMPSISKKVEELQAVEWWPYRQMIAGGLKAVMGAHIKVEGAADGLPATLSHKISYSWLREELGFTGLLFTDALDMKGISAYYPSGELERRALEAGNDVLLYPTDIGKAIVAIESGIQEGTLTEEQLSKKVDRIQEAKQWAGLLGTKNTVSFPQKEEIQKLNFSVCGASLTGLGIQPFEFDSGRQFVNLIASNQQKTTYTSMPHHNFEQQTKGGGFGYLANLLGLRQSQLMDSPEVKNTLVSQAVICFHSLAFSAAVDFGLAKEQINWVTKQLENKATQLIIFGNPYVLQLFPNWRNARSILVTYQESQEAIETAARYLKGEIKAGGRLPIALS